MRFAHRKDPREEVHIESGVLVHPEGAPIEEEYIPECVEWIIAVTECNRQTDGVVIGYAGNDPAMDWAYGDVCLVVRVAGDRLAYRTVAQLESQIDGLDS